MFKIGPLDQPDITLLRLNLWRTLIGACPRRRYHLSPGHLEYDHSSANRYSNSRPQSAPEIHSPERVSERVQTPSACVWMPYVLASEPPSD
jgi:hypothetical protein